MNTRVMVYLVDDDPEVRASLKLLLEIHGYEVAPFDSAIRFLAAYPREMRGCLIADIRMPDMDGLQLQDELKRRGMMLPVIIITGHGDVPLAVRAMKAGAVDFLEKPFREEALLDCIRRALKNDDTLQNGKPWAEVTSKLGELTRREQEVLGLVVEGLTNKEIARILDISPRTVDIHRAHVMEKMQAASLADLVRMAIAPNPR